MRWRTLPLQLLLLVFLLVFLVYPLAYVVPGAASDIAYDVVLVRFGDTPEQRSQAAATLAGLKPGPALATTSLRLPQPVRSYPTLRGAEELARRLHAAGAQVEIVRQRQWTTFYFRQALGFRLQRAAWFPWVQVMPNSPYLWDCLFNSLTLAVLTTVTTTLLCLPLACGLTRYRFRGRGLLTGLLLVPLILPPFVGAIGLHRFLERFGALNLTLMKLGLIAPNAPIDWVGEGGFLGVAMMQVLSLYPIMYLNLAAAWANLDPTLEDAARNLGASEWRVFRTVTFPLLVPGYFAGAAIVFVWAFTDLGTPLVFNYQAVIPVQIFDQVSDAQRSSSVAYALVVVTLVVTGVLFGVARWLVGTQTYVGSAKGAVAVVEREAGCLRTVLIYSAVLGLTSLAAIPHVGVLLTAFAERWSFTAFPEAFTTHHLGDVWTNRIAALSIRNSVSYSACSTLLDLILGVTIAWLVVRRPSWLSAVLDGLATLPLALPGLVLAFGYLTCYSNWDLGPASNYLDPQKNPVALLVIAYAVRRLPYVTRSALAGLQQIPPVLEEAAENLGAGRWRVLRTVTLPLIGANLLAGVILTFAFAVLEVSDSLMLAQREQFYPITRAIIGLLMRPDDGEQIASALAVFAMILLGLSLLAAALVLGRKMGQLFRA